MPELKKLRFADPMPQILFTGEKNKTFRVTRGERYQIGDNISLCYVDGEEFAQATITNNYIKTFKELTPEDWNGHERFVSDEEMYAIYSKWEGFRIGPETELRVICYENFKPTKESLPAQTINLHG